MKTRLLVTISLVATAVASFGLGAWLTSRHWVGEAASGALAQAGAEEVLLESALRLREKGDSAQLDALLNSELDSQVLAMCSLIDAPGTPREGVAQAEKILKRVAEYRLAHPAAEASGTQKDSAAAFAAEKRGACLKRAREQQ